MPVPGRVIVAGDWHANARWACGVIEKAAKILADEEPRLILHAGDFGIWPGPEGGRYLQVLDQSLRRHGMLLAFVDENHEDHPQLPTAQEKAGVPAVPVPVISNPFDPGGSPRIVWLPRGCRWEWYGRTWLALGGAVSPDRVIRTEGANWWPEEAITPQQAQDAADGGPADVMLTHDVPAAVPVAFPPPPHWWDDRDLARGDVNRMLLQSVADKVQPGEVIHGHLHRAYQKVVAMDHGLVRVTGLDCDGSAGNYRVLDVRTMEWD